MIIENGKIKKSKTKEDQEFRKKLKYYLKHWFNLELNDIIIIMEEIGVTADSYDLVYDDRSSTSKFCFKVINKFNTIYISFYFDNNIHKAKMSVFKSEYSTSNTYYLSKSITLKKV